MDLCNLSVIKSLMADAGISFRKEFGQNFLIDTHVLERIIDESGITKDDMVLEIGPGIGTMTQYLCENAREVVAVEIDKMLIPILTEDTLKEYDNVTKEDDLFEIDILDSTGKVIGRVKLFQPRIDGIDGLEFSYNKLERQVETFDLKFRFNNIDFDIL